MHNKILIKYLYPLIPSKKIKERLKERYLQKLNKKYRKLNKYAKNCDISKLTQLFSKMSSAEEINPKRLERFFPVVEKLVDLKLISGERYDTINELVKQIKRQDFVDAYKNALQNSSSVAIVGNGSQTMDSGNAIDACEDVIRFNYFNLTGYESSAGTKTTIWIGGHCTHDFNHVLFNVKQLDKLKLICINRDIIKREILANSFFNFLLEVGKNHLSKCCLLNPEVYQLNFFGTRPNGSFVTGRAGFIAMYYLRKMNKLNFNNVYGFSYTETELSLKVGKHFYEDFSKETHWQILKNNYIHNELKENEIIRSWKKELEDKSKNTLS